MERDGRGGGGRVEEEVEGCEEEEVGEMSNLELSGVGRRSADYS